MTESDMESGSSSESGRGRSRWCFVIDTAGRIVLSVETAPRPEEGPAPAAMTRPSFDTPWWALTVEADERGEAARTALALVEDDRMSYGLPDCELDQAAAATPEPVLAGWPGYEVKLGAPDAPSFADIYQAIMDAPVPDPVPRAFSSTSFVIAAASSRAADIIAAANAFTRVRTYRQYLDHSEQVVAPTADIELLVGQAEFWRREFTYMYNRAGARIEELENEVEELRALLGDGEEPEDEAPESRECVAIACPEYTEITVEFDESTWEMAFDLNGRCIGINYGPYLNLPELAAGDAPRITEPDPAVQRWMFIVSVRATNSATALEIARAAVVEAHGLTGDAFAVMDGTKTPEEAGTTPAQLAWVWKWAQFERGAHLGLVDEIAANIERLEQAGAAL